MVRSRNPKRFRAVLVAIALTLVANYGISYVADARPQADERSRSGITSVPNPPKPTAGRSGITSVPNPPKP
jgi:hypothetical protein